MFETFFKSEINWHPFIEAHLRRFQVDRCVRWAQFIVGGFITVTIADQGEEKQDEVPTRWKITLRGFGRKETADLPGHLVFGEVLHAAMKAVQRWRLDLQDLAGVSDMPHTTAV